MTNVIFVAKACCLTFFGIVFVINLVDLLNSRVRAHIDSELYFEKQMWMLISLLAIAIVLGRL